MEDLLIPEPHLEKAFSINVCVNKPVVAGHDNTIGRRQLIEISSGEVSGKLSGKVLPGGVDSQIIRPDGFVELSARYAVLLDSGQSFYIENNGIRRVDPEFAEEVAAGKIVDPRYVYFVTVPKFEVYDESLKWLEKSIFICYAVRLPDSVLLNFYQII
jgi:hypothetical protein